MGEKTFYNPRRWHDIQFVLSSGANDNDRFVFFIPRIYNKVIVMHLVCITISFHNMLLHFLVMIVLRLRTRRYHNHVRDVALHLHSSLSSRRSLHSDANDSTWTDSIIPSATQDNNRWKVQIILTTVSRPPGRTSPVNDCHDVTMNFGIAWLPSPLSVSQEPTLFNLICCLVVCSVTCCR